MGAPLQFSIDLQIENAGALPELSARLEDFRPAWDAIVRDWAQHNEDKFAKGVGMESSGADVDDIGLFWTPLTPAYMKRKRKLGFPDALMHATGTLESVMTDPDRFFHEEMPEQVAFGNPMDEDDEMKIRGNWNRRQVVFLGAVDQESIKMVLGEHLALGPDFEHIRFQEGLDAISAEKQSATMDMEFGEAMEE